MKKRQLSHKCLTERTQYEKLRQRYFTHRFITDDMWAKIRKEFNYSVDEKIAEVYLDKELTKSQLNRLYKKCVNHAYNVHFRSSNKCAFFEMRKNIKRIRQELLGIVQ